MDMFEKIIYEMYGLTLTEYGFQIADGLISIVCAIILFIGIFKYHRRVRTSNSKLLLVSISGLLFFSTVSGIAVEILFIDNEKYSFFELMLIYLPTAFIVLLTYGFWILLKESRGRSIGGS